MYTHIGGWTHGLVRRHIVAGKRPHVVAETHSARFVSLPQRTEEEAINRSQYSFKNKYIKYYMNILQ